MQLKLSAWRFFFIVNILLLILSIWQIVEDSGLTVILILGTLSLFLHYLRRKKGKNTNLLLWLGIVLIFISLINSYVFWLMLVFIVLFIGIKGFEIIDLDYENLLFWRKKNIIMVQTKEPSEEKEFISKKSYIGTQMIGNEVFEFDDINLTIFVGDSIIDLGNTILPKGKNVIVLRKGFGRTRILVPHGIQIDILHEAFRGEFHFQQYHYSLNAEEVKIHDMKYAESERKIKIISNVIMGDLEVIRV